MLFGLYIVSIPKANPPFIRPGTSLIRELQKIKPSKNPQAQAWSYTDKARLRGLKEPC